MRCLDNSEFQQKQTGVASLVDSTRRIEIEIETGIEVGQTPVVNGCVECLAF